MLILETVLRIRREHASGKAIKVIARDLHLSRKVVRKAIRAPEADMGYRREMQPLPKLGPFQARLDALLEEDEARPRREKLRLTRIHDLLLREGFDGSYDAVRRYAARWRQARRRDVMNAPAFIPLLFRPGEAYQFDWSHEDVDIAGKPMRVYQPRGAERLAGGRVSALGRVAPASRAEGTDGRPGMGSRTGGAPACCRALRRLPRERACGKRHLPHPLRPQPLLRFCQGGAARCAGPCLRRPYRRALRR